MNRTYRHLCYGLAWLVGFFFLALVIVYSIDSSSNIGVTKFQSQIGSLIWVLGFAAIFFSWARQDAVEHGKPRGAAIVFAVLWPFLVFISHFAYLLYTRGWKAGIISSLRFLSFLLAAFIGLATIGKLASLVTQ